MSVSPSRQIPVEASHRGGAASVQRVHTEKKTYVWVTPEETVGANKDYLDLFNASDENVVRIQSIKAIPSIDVAASVSTGIRIDLYRTSAVGTGGTAWDESATGEAAGGALNPADSSIGTLATLDSNITGRHLFTGGATIARWLNTRYVSTDEDGTPYTPEVELTPNVDLGQPLTLRQDEGIRVEQGSVASAGKVRFLVVFTVESV